MQSHTLKIRQKMMQSSMNNLIMKTHQWSESFMFTLSSSSSFPDKAKSKVVFPELGGPNNNVILEKKN